MLLALQGWLLQQPTIGLPYARPGASAFRAVLTPSRTLTVLTPSRTRTRLTKAATQNDIAYGLTSKWALGEALGELRLDGKDGNHLTSVNDVQQVAGRLPGQFAAGFNTSAQRSLHIWDDEQNGLNPGLSDFSISAFINIAALTNTFVIVGKGAIASGFDCEGYNFIVAPSGILFATLGDSVHTTIRGGQFATNLFPSLNVWHHVVMTVDRDGKFGVYLDLVKGGPLNPVDSDDVSHWGLTTGPCNPTAPFVTGAYGRNGFAGPPGTIYPFVFSEGAVQDLRFYNRVLTAAEIRALYEAAA
jgi:hypothetical protein